MTEHFLRISTFSFNFQFNMLKVQKLFVKSFGHMVTPGTLLQKFQTNSLSSFGDTLVDGPTDQRKVMSNDTPQICSLFK